MEKIKELMEKEHQAKEELRAIKLQVKSSLQAAGWIPVEELDFHGENIVAIEWVHPDWVEEWKNRGDDWSHIPDECTWTQ